MAAQASQGRAREIQGFLFRLPGAVTRGARAPDRRRANGRTGRSRKFVVPARKNPLRRGAIRTNSRLAQYARACGRVSVGGDLDKRPVNRRLERPAAGGEPANPAQRGTRLEATTDRAFLVSAGPPKVGAQRGLSILPGVRTGSPRPNDGSDRSRLVCLGRVLATAQLLTARAVRRRLSRACRRIRRRGRVGGSTTAHRVSNARRARSHRRRILHVFPGAERSARLGDGAHD